MGDVTQKGATVRYWPRVRCVYCGQRTDEPDPLDGTVFHPLACWRHRALVALDPHFTP